MLLKYNNFVEKKIITLFLRFHTRQAARHVSHTFRNKILIKKFRSIPLDFVNRMCVSITESTFLRLLNSDKKKKRNV